MSVVGTGKHWSGVVNQAVVQRGANGSFNLCIEGGSEYGQFVVIGDVLAEKVTFRSGSLTAGEIILEINGVHVAGYTQTDGITLIRDSGTLLRITSVQAGQGITRDLRKYLSTRFAKGSLDHELQQTIRDNLYMRTVPCTTRKPREGEVPGVDYEFLTVNEYLELEKSGKLLESGFYESNYYGTPKPPKQPMTPGTGTLRNPKVAKKMVQDKLRDGELGPLPSNWEMAFTREGEPYFVDHNSGKTQWEDPRKQKSVSTPKLNHIVNDADVDNELPTGWEKVDDPKYGTYYIDHVNRRTQYEKPDFAAVRKQSQGSRPAERDFDTQSRKSVGSTIDARKLQGETHRITLRKGAKGFGFTIVGGEQQGEVLQVNNIVRGGAADVDGRLRTGDIVMRLNGRNVLSWSHGDIIRFLQTTRVGEVVELDIVRGYPLPYDNTDTRSNGHGRGPGDMKRAMSNGSINVNDLPRENQMREQRNMLGSKSMGYLSDGEAINNARQQQQQQGATTPSMMRSGPPQYRVVKVVRGPNGFGFTIADSPYGQRVKEIIDRQRCQDLVQGDVIIRINSHVVHNLDHVDVVEVLKQCPKGQATSFQVQRSGVLTVVKSMPAPLAARGRNNQQRPKSMPSGLEQEDLDMRPVKESTSMGVIATNGEASNENTTTYEERSHPQVSAAGDGYKSLKRAVQSNARDVDEREAPPPAEGTPDVSEHLITLKRGAGGFGFRIIGGQEEKTQVKIDTIVANGEADKDGRLRHNDVILAVDGISVVDATHKRVISLMNNAALNGKVTLRVRRKGEDARPEEETNDRVPPTNTTSVNGHRPTNDSKPSRDRDRRKSDTESIHSDKQVQEWIEDHQQQRDHRPRDPYRGASQADTLRSKSESNINNNKSKTQPPPVAPKPQKSQPPPPQQQPAQPSPTPPAPVTSPRGKGTEITLTRNSNEGFGFVIMSSPSSKGSVIGRIIPGSPSDRCGELHVDDKLLAVNDQNVSRLSHSEIVSLVKNSGLQVKIMVQSSQQPEPVEVDDDDDDDVGGGSPPPPRPAEPRNYTPSYNKHVDNLREEFKQRQSGDESSENKENVNEAQQRSSPKTTGGKRKEVEKPAPVEPAEKPPATAPSPPPPIGVTPTAVKLKKAAKGFGFSIRGGDGISLYVLRIAPDGAAALDGRIEVGDEILEINGDSTEPMSHAEAVNTIRNCTEEVTLLIRRVPDENSEND